MSAAARVISQGTNVILSRQLPDAARDLQLEEGRKDFGRGEPGIEIFEDLVDLQRFVAAQNLEDHGFFGPKYRVRQKRCSRFRFGFIGGFGLERNADLRRQIFPHIFPGGDQLCALFDQRVSGPRHFYS